MIKIGITGNIATGKSIIESFLNKKGINAIDADRVVHALLDNDKEVIQKVSAIFAPDNINVKNEKGGISREKVGNIVFKDDAKLKKLEKILHPKVIEEFEKFFNNNICRKIVVGIVPLLYEANMEKMFDYVILVTVNKDIQLNRLKKRDNLTEEKALGRINCQNVSGRKN